MSALRELAQSAVAAAILTVSCANQIEFGSAIFFEAFWQFFRNA
jgi:hypothetical protein